MLSKIMQVVLVVSLVFMLPGLPMGFLLLQNLPAETPQLTDDVYRIAWAVIIGSTCALLALLNLLVVQPWFAARTRARQRWEIALDSRIGIQRPTLPPTSQTRARPSFLVASDGTCRTRGQSIIGKYAGR